MRLNSPDGLSVAIHVMGLAVLTSVIAFCGTPEKEFKIFPDSSNNTEIVEDYEPSLGYGEINCLDVAPELGSRVLTLYNCSLD